MLRVSGSHMRLFSWPETNLEHIGDTIDNLALDAFLVNARSVAHVTATTANSTALIDAEIAAVGKMKIQVIAKEPAGGFGLVDLGFSCRGHHDEL